MSLYRLNVLIITMIVLSCAIVEIVTGYIYDAITLPAIILGLISGIPNKDFKDRLISLILMFVIILVSSITYDAFLKNQTMGGGTLKLMFAISAFFCFRQSVFFFVFFIILMIAAKAALLCFPELVYWDKLPLIYLGDGLVRSGFLIFAALLSMVFFTKPKNT